MQRPTCSFSGKGSNVVAEPYIVTLLIGGIAALFGALGKVALELLKRGDRAHAEIVAQWEARLQDSENRCEEWRQLALAEHTTTREAVDAVKKVR